MGITASEIRLDGIYPQRQEGYFMQRVKLPAGVVSAIQARQVARIAATFGKGTIHLTTRGSMEIHWLKAEDLPAVKRELAKAGLTGRGACGGAVRGITCGSQSSAAFPEIENLARRLQRHFAGNPRFERLPKKFKIGIEAGAAGGRHLVQDVGLVLAGFEDGRNLYDIWIAGGLGREPRSGFLYARELSEERLIPIIEAILRVYAAHAPPPKRLKYLAAQFGQEKLCQLIEAEGCFSETLPEVKGLADRVAPIASSQRFHEIEIFAGKMTAVELADLATQAEHYADGVMLVTPAQNIALPLVDNGHTPAFDKWASSAERSDGRLGIRELRVCPGSHECAMGLAPTREVASSLLTGLSDGGRQRIWAVSGCANSCSQPQLAEYGIVSSRLDKEGQPLFDLYRRSGDGLGERIRERLSLAALLEETGRIC